MDFKATLSVTLSSQCENSVVNFKFCQYKMSLLVPFKKLKTRATVRGGGAVDSRVRKSALWDGLCWAVGCMTRETANCLLC